MKMKPLDQYKRKKQKDPLSGTPRSVNLEERHHEFLEDFELNLSEMVRDMLDEKIKQSGVKKYEKTSA